MIDTEAVKHVEEHIGEDELKRLNGFARALAHSSYYGGDRGPEAVPGGGSHRDIVVEAVEKTLRTGEESYTWDRERNPTIFDHLRYVVRDILRNRHRRKEQELSAGRVDASDIERRGPQVDMEEKMERDREKQRAETQIDTLRKAVENREDPLMEEVFDGLLDGELKRSEIAEILEVELRDYDNAYKRVMRLGAKVLSDGRTS